jgi:hypothetical protein
MSYVLAQTRLDAVFDNRPATAVGLLGTTLCGLLAALLAHASMGTAGIDDEGLDELAFLPGMVLALGSPGIAERVTDPGVTPPSPPAPPATPDPSPTPADAAEDAPLPDDAVTDVATPPAPPRPARPRAEPPKPAGGPSQPSLPPPPGPAGPAGNPSKGDPFGDPNGLDDLTSAGDPWARGVLAAIEGMDVGTIYAHPIAGNVRFQLTICKDGTISRVGYKGGTASVDERDLVILELGRLKIPRPPADIAAHMQGSCAKLKHTFSWSVDSTR